MNSYQPRKKMRALPAILLATLFSVSACVSTTPIIYEDGRIDIVFCQEENCEEKIITELKKARDIRCAFYDTGLENLTKTLIEKNAEVLIFRENDDEAPNSWTRVKSSGLMHNKYCVLDKKITITGSMNPTYNGVNRNDNNILFIESPRIAHNYLTEWYELKKRSGQQTTGVTELVLDLGDRNVTLENYFCPEDKCEKKVLEELSAAQKNIYFMTFSFTSDPIGALLIQKHMEGIAVQGVFESRQNDRYSEYPKLLEAGVNVRKDGNPYTMHHKVFIIDSDTENATVITGSYNPTKAGTTINDENMLIIHDHIIAQEFLGEYERIWEETK
ncbi:hypothetical protein GOV10_04570 [Candidatus Woesearchaeota archaeon]|nr:hypothetical protein [Candidatus Woesearchaeota archaeon]